MTYMLWEEPGSLQLVNNLNESPTGSLCKWFRVLVPLAGVDCCGTTVTSAWKIARLQCGDHWVSDSGADIWRHLYGICRSSQESFITVLHKGNFSPLFLWSHQTFILRSSEDLRSYSFIKTCLTSPRFLLHLFGFFEHHSSLACYPDPLGAPFTPWSPAQDNKV